MRGCRELSCHVALVVRIKPKCVSLISVTTVNGHRAIHVAGSSVITFRYAYYGT